MKNLKSTLLCVALFSSAILLPALAQQGENKQKSKAGDNWFISIGGGINLLQAEQDEKQSVGDRIRFGGELSVGKWFTPAFGMRTQFYLGSLRGFNLNENQGGLYTRSDRDRSEYPINWEDAKKKDDGFWQDFTMEAATIDLMANLTNLFRGYYRDNAPVEFIPYVGFGWMHAVKGNTNPTFNGIGGKLGMRVNFNVANKLAIYLEPQAYFISDEFDGYVGNRGYDVVSNVMAGVQFNINKNFSSITNLSQNEIDLLNQKINDQYQMIENQQTILERQQQMLNNLENKSNTLPANNYQPQTGSSLTGKYLPEYIRFGLNSSSIDISEKHKIEDAADYLKANPTSKLLLIGYADRKTGNSKYNYKLSCKRVDTIANQLKAMGIDANRLIIDCVGDKEQPYDQNEWNRVVIMVERK